MPLSIQTNQLKTRKHVIIDGHPYTVRRLGNIERMDLDQYIRRLGALAATEKASDGKLSAEESAEVDELSRKIQNLVIGQFDDGGDQSLSRALVASLTEDEIGVLMEKIFVTESTDGPEQAKA
jgi:hypothetical protein